MFASQDAIDGAEARALSFVRTERADYDKFIAAGEEFAAANGLIAGGSTATRLLLGAARSLDAYQCCLYGDRLPAQAFRLADTLRALDPNGLGRYAAVWPRVPGFLYMVSVNGRDLFSITALHVHRGVRTADMIMPVPRPAYFAVGKDGRPQTLQCMGAEVQLMAVYAVLCNPAKADEWAGLLGAEAALRALFVREIRSKVAAAIARAAGGAAAGGAAAGSHLTAALRSHFIGGPGRVVVGPAAIAWLQNREPGAGTRLQVISSGALESERREVETIARRVGVKIGWTLNDPKIPADFRLRRLTVYELAGSGRTPVLDVFNAAAHELVPYIATGGGRRLGTPFVLMRFRLADLWTMQMILRLRSVSDTYAAEAMRAILGDYDAAALIYTKKLAGVQLPAVGADAAAESVLPRDTYIGRLEEAERALKRAASKERAITYLAGAGMSASDRARPRPTDRR